MTDLSDKKIFISAIVAVARNGVIGSDNDLPWHLPEDLQYFKDMTLGKPIIMGRKTFDSVGKPLPKRRNIVVTRNQELRIDGADVVTTLDEAVAIAKEYCRTTGQDEIMVVGGEGVYTMALPILDRIYLTDIDASPDGDTYFPTLGEEWQEVSCRPPQQPSNPTFTFRILERVPA